MINPYQNTRLTNIIKFRPVELDNVKVNYENQHRSIMCFCGIKVSQSIVPHFKNKHSVLWNTWKEVFVKLNSLGFSLKEIMQLFSDKEGKLLFSWTVIEKNIRDEIETGNIVYKPALKKKITRWEPENFILEKTTIWDFPKRGDWAVHQGDYRGNWPPQIPRNLIKKYTKSGDLVIDVFAGGGTTLIEAWLLNRRSIGLDISHFATQYMNSRLDEMNEKITNKVGVNINPLYRPTVIEGNALDLNKILKTQGIQKNKVRLICAHPPYLDSIKYSNNKYDLGIVHDVDIFCEKILVLAKEVKNVLSSDGVCAVLVGDVRRNKKVIPLGFRVLNSFLSQGFEIEDIIIKTQHRDKSSEFWLGHKSEIILMAHEYLFILRLHNEPR